MTRVALVEDDLDLVEDVAFALRDEGFEVVTCGCGKELDRAMAQTQFDVVVLDIGLPDEDGLSIARRLRASQPELGIVMLTARTVSSARVQGMEEGADAYLGKPTDLRELALVIHALVRRLGAGKPPDALALTLVASDNLLLTPGGASLDLTPTETLLLSRLARMTGHKASRRQIIEGFGEAYFDYDERRLEAIVSRLRRKLESIGLPADTVQAVRGSGYVLNAPIEERAGRAYSPVITTPY
jgi:DNA-binding response OmpR family regulator